VAVSVAARSENDLLKLALAAFRALRGTHLIMAAVIAAGLLLAGCTTRGGPVAYDVQDFGTPDEPEDVKLENYKIEPLDALRLSVFQVPDLSGDFEVDLKGNIVLPLVGTVKAAGLTQEELQADVQKRLRKYMKDPVVSLAVKPSVGYVMPAPPASPRCASPCRRRTPQWRNRRRPSEAPSGSEAFRRARSPSACDRCAC